MKSATVFSVSLIKQKQGTRQGTSIRAQGTGIDEIPAEFLKF